ncbi:MAG: UDP-N-acetylmuramate--L-alanine ligase [Candidatus Moraniibacteriota bacterium]
MNIKDLKKVYLVGIKGAGMTAVAELLKGRGIQVSGSDTSEVFYTDAILKKNEIAFFETFEAGHLEGDFDAVIFSTAYSVENNVELQTAKAKNLPMLSYPEFLGMLFREKLGIAVCGSHGKTTTSALLGQALQMAGADPTALVGSKVLGWDSSVLAGKGDYFVAEADEYQNKLRFYDPWSVILTSVDWDHPDFFPTFADYKKAFQDFVAKIPKAGFLVVWGDSVDTLEVAKAATCQVLSYGFGQENKYKISNLKLQISNQDLIHQSFEIERSGQNLGTFLTPLAGKHNVLNCASVVALCHAMGLDLAKVALALKQFRGTARRFEQVGTFKNAILIDDYAHHPDEIKATLSGARARFGEKRIWTVFHPHTFTRTKALLQDFAQSFDDTDKVIVIDIYGSAREAHGGVSSAELVALINKYQFGKAQYLATMEEVVSYVKENAGDFEVLITMGAGDVWKVAQKLLHG